MKRLTIFVLFLFLNVDYALAEVVEIPDPNLRKVLSEAIGINPERDITKKALASVNNLFVFDKGISDISGIEHCTKLKVLDLRNNLLTDISGLNGANLPKLEVLDLQDNQITDISGLSGADLPKLEKLTLQNNEITDISVLNWANFPNLVYLSLHQNPLSNDTVLNQIPKLKETIPHITVHPVKIPIQLTGDVNGDGTVNIFDLVIAAGSFGKTGDGRCQW